MHHCVNNKVRNSQNIRVQCLSVHHIHHEGSDKLRVSDPHSEGGFFGQVHVELFRTVCARPGDV